MSDSAHYLCVCGERLALRDGAESLHCPRCRRYHPRSALLHPSAATVTMDGTPAAIPLSDGKDPRIGSRLGHFRLLSRISGGGMGVVYRALDESLERYVAIKALYPGGGTHQRIEHLLEEAVAQARINHPNVVHIYYVGRDPAEPFLAMELVEGGTLAARISRQPLSFPETIAVARQLAEAMRQASDLGITHGDIKPGNVLLDRQQHVKLTDFGLSRLAGRGASERVAGTADYMAPEMWEGRVGQASDMYALGVTLFEITFGRRTLNLPEGASASEIAMAHRTQPAAFPAPWPAELPPAWRHVLQRLLAKRPEDRYPSYDALIADLRDVTPVRRPAAGRIQRALAWVVDVAILQTALNLIGGVMELPQAPPSIQAALGLLGFVVVLATVVVGARWGRTPGKKLFQLRVVDPHGLPPTKATLLARGGWVLSPIWLAWWERCVRAQGLVPLLAGPANPVSTFWLLAAVQLALLLDVACAWFFTRRQALHDWLLRHEVVLDASSAS